MSDPALLRIYLLGAFRVVTGFRPIPESVWRRRRPAALFKVLALSPGFRIHREQLVEILWPDLSIKSAANNLNVTVHELRRLIETSDSTGLLSVDRLGQTVALSPVDRIWVDAVEFESAISTAWRSAEPGSFWRAIDLYTGDLLPDDRYDDWVERRRSALRASYLTALSRLATIHEQQGNDDGAVAALTLLCNSDPLDEDAARSLMKSLARSGQRTRALAHYKALTDALERELGTHPEEATRSLHDALLPGGPHPGGGTYNVQQQTPDTSGDSSEKVPASNLPAEVTPIIGREREIAELEHHLANGRLVTITGPGGVGKTVLARVLARCIADTFTHVYQVELDMVREPAFVLPAIARAIRIHEPPGHSTAESLAAFFGVTKTLLLLDNFEHVVEAAPELAYLLARCRGLKLIVTSRTRLRLRGEHEYVLSPLSFPTFRQSFERASQFPAVELFHSRVRQLRPDVDVSGLRLRTISEICQRLDGLPLAIELAAARCKALSPEELLPLLERRLSLLTGGPRELPERQQTIRNTISWSYELLESDEQRLLCHLSIFLGGWNLESARAVCETAPGGHSDSDLLDQLFELVDHNLVLVDEMAEGTTRFRMLETIREFCLEKLEASGEMPEVSARHAHFFSVLVETATSHFYGSEQAVWIDRFDEDHANIQRALDWFLSNDLNRGLRVIGQLWLPWWMKQHLAIGRHYYDAFLEGVSDSTVDDLTYAHALSGAGIIAEWQGDTDRSTFLGQKAISIWMDLSHPPDGSYWPFISLGNIALEQSDLTLAKHWFQKGFDFARLHRHKYGITALRDCLARIAEFEGQYEYAESLHKMDIMEARSRGDMWSISFSTGNYGFMLLDLDRLQEARPLLEESLHAAERLGIEMYRVESLKALGLLYMNLGELEHGEALLNESLAIAVDTADFSGISGAKLGLAMIAHRRGEKLEAARLFRESLDQSNLSLDQTTVPRSLDGLAAVYSDLGQFEQAVRLHAFAESFRTHAGIVVNRTHYQAVMESMDRARSSLTSELMDQAWLAGQNMTLDQVRTKQLAPLDI